MSSKGGFVGPYEIVMMINIVIGMFFIEEDSVDNGEDENGE